jgi:hypothetical protein
MDDVYLQIMEHKVKIVKMAGDMAGTPHSVESPLGKEYTFRVSKISSMVTCDRNLKPADALTHKFHLSERSLNESLTGIHNSTRTNM